MARMTSSTSPSRAVAATYSASACSRPSPTCHSLVRRLPPSIRRRNDQRRKGSRRPPASVNRLMTGRPSHERGDRVNPKKHDRSFFCIVRPTVRTNYRRESVMNSTTAELATYAIRRKNAWGSVEEVEQVAARSKQVAEEEFPSDIRWIRSYVLAEEDGTLGSVCIYQASSPEAIRKHAQRVGMPADEIFPVGETVVIRPDPVKEP